MITLVEIIWSGSDLEGSIGDDEFSQEPKDMEVDILVDSIKLWEKTVDWQPLQSLMLEWLTVFFLVEAVADVIVL